jgi:hypothetical protein
MERSQIIDDSDDISIGICVYGLILNPARTQNFQYKA